MDENRNVRALAYYGATVSTIAILWILFGAEGPLRGSMIAVYGAILSTVALGLHIYRGWQEKGRLRVIVSLTRSGKTDGSDLQLWLHVTCSNPGARPITAKSVLVARGTPGQAEPVREILVTENLPTELTEGAACNLVFDASSFVASGICSVYVEDALGRRWRSRRSHIREINEHLKKMRGLESCSENLVFAETLSDQLDDQRPEKPWTDTT